MLTGEAVYSERTRRGLSRTKFADLVGLTPTKIANIERGRDIRPEEAALLAPHVTVLTADPVPTDYDPTNSSVDNGDSSSQHSRWATPGSAVILLDEDAELWLVDPVGSDESLSPPIAEGLVPTTEATPSPVAVSVPSTVPGDASGGPPAPTSAPGTATVSLPEVVGVDALYVDDRRRISNSELQTFKHCRRRWWLGWFRGLRLRDEPQTGPLPLGTRVHLALAAYYVPAGQVPVDPREELEGILARDELRVLASVHERDASDAATVMADFKHDADLARAMIEGYVEWLAETGADQGYRVIAPEQALFVVIPMSGEYPDILLTGRLDVRLRRESDGVVLFMDHKTTGSFEQLTKMLVWDEQMRHYHVLERGNRQEGDPPVAGALYNMLRKVKRTAQANPPFFQRVEVRHSTHDLDKFTTRLIGEYEELMHVQRQLTVGADHQRVAYPSPGDRCTWGCEFSAVCPMFDDGSRAEDFITEHYVRVNPLDRYDDETKPV